MTENYRPVSLLFVVSKVFEKLVNNRLPEIILFYFHYGSRSSRSTADHLALLYNKIAMALNRSAPIQRSGIGTIIFFTNSSLNGILYQVFGIISSFLINRRLRMVLDGQHQKNGLLNAGVPQVSILRPSLSLLYIIDVHDHVIGNIAIYTGDTTRYSKSDQVCNLWQQLQLKKRSGKKRPVT